MKYNLFEINERLQNEEITPEQARKELLILFDVSVPKGTLVCPNNEQHIVKKESVGKYCMVCGLLK